MRCASWVRLSKVTTAANSKSWHPGDRECILNINVGSQCWYDNLILNFLRRAKIVHQSESHESFLVFLAMAFSAPGDTWQDTLRWRFRYVVFCLLNYIISLRSSKRADCELVSHLSARVFMNEWSLVGWVNGCQNQNRGMKNEWFLVTRLNQLPASWPLMW